MGAGEEEEGVPFHPLDDSSEETSSTLKKTHTCFHQDAKAPASCVSFANENPTRVTPSKFSDKLEPPLAQGYEW